MAVYVKNKLVSSTVDKFIINGGESVLDLVNRTNMPEVLHDYLRASVDGVVIPKEQWANTHVYQNHVVYLAVVPQGGDSGKNPLAMIAMVALAYFTFNPMGVQGWGSIMGGSAIAGNVVAAGVMFVGALAINALFPPPTPDEPGYADDSSGFLGFDGIRNQARPHGAIRSIYGTYKVAPDVGAQNYTQTNGDIQTLYALYDFGYGEVEVSNIMIGNTPIQNYHDTYYKIHTNYTNAALDYYKNDHVLEGFSAEITKTTTTRTTPSNDSDEAYINIQFPVGLAKFPEEGGMEKDTVTLNVMVEKTDGSTGLVPAQDLPEVTASHAIVWDNTYAREMVITNLYTEVGGGATQGYIQMTASSTFTADVYGSVYTDSLFPVSPMPLRVGQGFYINGEYFEVTVATTTGTVTNNINVGQDETGGVIYNYQKVTSYNITLDHSTTAGEKIYDTWSEICVTAYTCFTTWVHQDAQKTFTLTPAYSGDFSITRATAKAFVFALNLKFPSNGEWDIHIKRTDDVLYEISAGWDDKYADKTILTAIDSVTYRQPLDLKVGHTILELKVKASDQLSGVIDTVNAICRRKLPIYNGSTWSDDYTSNPAWIALDVLMGDCNPDPIPESRIDLTAFKNWADFCTTNGYTCNANWDGKSTVFERYLSVLSTGRATLSMRENKYSVIYESFPTVPVQMFTPANSWGFKGTKVFTKQPHAINVKFVDPLSEWQLVDRVVYADGYNETNATYFENISLPLCTDSDLAWKFGRYYLAAGKLRPETFESTTDIENLISERGDLITFAHDVSRIGGATNRITAISGSNVTLREPVSWAASPNYFLRIRYNTGTQEEIQVTAQVDSNTITLASAPTSANVGDLCIYGEENLVVDEFLIKSVRPGADLTATLELVPIARDIATADTGTIPDYEPQITEDIMLYPACVLNASVNIELSYENRYPFVDVSLSWQTMGTNVSYEIWLSKSGDENYELIDTTIINQDYKLYDKKSTLDVDYIKNTDLYVKVIPVNHLGLKAEFNTCSPIVFQLPYDTTAPGKPLFFAGNINADMMNLTWLPPTDKDIAGYIIKYSPDTTATVDWDEAVSQGSLIPYNITQAAISARIGSYMIKTLDTSGNYSTAFGLVKTTIPQLTGFDNFSTLTEHSTFTGDKTDVEVVSSGLRLVQDVGGYKSYGTYIFSSVVDLTDVYRTYCSAEIVASIINSGSLPTLESDSEVIVQIRVSTYNPSISDWTTLSSVTTLSAANDDSWSGWMNLTAGYYTGRYYQFRAILVSNKTYITPHVSFLKAKVDLIERTEGQNDVTCAVNGSSITFVSEFESIPAIAITQDNASNGDYYQITNQAVGGFDIEFFNSSNTSITAQFDYIATGYGELQTATVNAIEAGDEDSIDLLPSAVSYLSRKELLT